MAAIKHGDADRFLAAPLRDCTVVLLFGPDQGLVSERAVRLLARLVDDPADPFQLVRLDGDDVAGDPQRLIDEVNTIPLFGGRRAIRLALGSKSVTAGLQPVLEAGAAECPVVIEAGDLKPAHALRQMVEKSRHGAAVACYEDDGDRLGRLIAEEMTQAGLRLAPASRAALLQALGANRAASRLELRKLADYCAGEGEVTLEAVEAVVGDVGKHDLDTLIDAAFSADFATLEKEAGPQLRQSGGTQAITAAALRHALLLQALAHAGQSAAESILAAGRVFYKRRSLVERQAKLWPAAKADKAVALLAEAQLASRRNAALAVDIVERSLWSVALAARR